VLICCPVNPFVFPAFVEWLRWTHRSWWDFPQTRRHENGEGVKTAANETAEVGVEIGMRGVARVDEAAVVTVMKVVAVIEVEEGKMASPKSRSWCAIFHTRTQRRI
jgi:hypothetical protein